MGAMAHAVFQLNFQPSLGKMASVAVITPEGKPGPFPVLYLLHGLSDDHSAWTRWTSLERYAMNLPLIIVMPDGGRSFYVNHKEQPFQAFERFMTDDLIRFTDRTFRTIPNRNGRALAGLSMGGYGAMRLALGRPDLYAAAVSHSGALHQGHDPISPTDEWQKQWVPWFGKWPMGGPDDLYALSERLPKSRRPKLRIDCGRKDFLINANRAFHKHLKRIRYPHEYAEHPGAHDWAYWDRHIKDTLSFVAKTLRISRPPAPKR